VDTQSSTSDESSQIPQDEGLAGEAPVFDRATLHQLTGIGTPASGATIRQVVAGAAGVPAPQQDAAGAQPPPAEAAPSAEAPATRPWSEVFPVKIRVLAGVAVAVLVVVVIVLSTRSSSGSGESDGYDTGLVGGVSAQGLDSSPTVDSFNSASVCYTESNRDPGICDSYYQAGMANASYLLSQAMGLTNYTPECFGFIGAFQTTINTTVQPTGYNWDAYATAARKVAQGANDLTLYC
jgi:hypothetical protein